jgi:tRNA dimethylallyltransferase
VPLLCGGTGLYIEAATCGYDFDKRYPVIDPALFPHNTYYIGTLVDRETRNARIDARLDARLAEGLVDEVRGLLDAGVPAETLIYYGLEYKFVTQHVLGILSYDEMRTLLGNAIHQFAKRQMTWFRGMERDGIVIHWTEV